MTQFNLHRAGLVLAAIGTLTVGAAFAQTEAPAGETPIEQGNEEMVGQGGMMGEGGMIDHGAMMSRMAEMMEACERMMQAMPQQDGATDMQPDNG